MVRLDNVAPPVFFNVTVCAELVVFSVCPVNVKLGGFRLTIGALATKLFTRLATFTVPSPLARSYPTPVLKVGW
jgi:hypothetical protein